MQNHLLQIVLYPMCVSSGISCRITCCRLYCIVCVSSGTSCRITCCRLYCILCVYLQGYHAESPAADCIVLCVCIFRDIIQNHLLQIVLYPVCVSSGISCRITCCRLYAADCIVLCVCVSSGISCRITCCRLYCIMCVYLQGYHAESPAADCIVSYVCIFRDIMQNHLLQIVLYCVCVSSGTSCRITCCRLYCILCVYLQGYHAESPAADCIVYCVCVSPGISCIITCYRLYCIMCVYLQGYHAESPAADCIVLAEQQPVGR